MNIFNSQYDYPFFRYNLRKIYENYNECSFESKQWVKSYYEPFSEDKYLKVLKK